jgi:hypothetical protein
MRENKVDHMIERWKMDDCRLKPISSFEKITKPTTCTMMLSQTTPQISIAGT